MALRVRKRHVLIILIACTQALCLTWGIGVFSAWIRSSLWTIVHDQVVADNVQTAGQLATLIREIEVSDIRENRDSWARLQSIVDDIRLPNDGFVCVADAADGAILCHPQFDAAVAILHGESPDDVTMSKNAAPASDTSAPMMKKKMMLPDTAQKSASVATPDPPMMKKDMPVGDPDAATPAGRSAPMMKKKMMLGAAESTGELSQRVDITSQTTMYDGELQIIAAAYLPGMDAHVNVHQKASGIQARIDGIVAPVLPIGLMVSLAIVFSTTGLITFIVHRYENRLAAINEGLEDLVRVRSRSLLRTRDAVVFGLAKLAESRDTDTGSHLERIRRYVGVLAWHLADPPEEIDEAYIDRIQLASSLHDIGKVAIPDAVLLKPGKLTAEEREIMETHAKHGGECLAAIGQKLGEDDFLQMSHEIAMYHHEKWDGTGYPHGLAETMIPLSARLVALADVYDALRSRRPYKEPMPHAKAKQIILEGRGTHFDPDVVDAFLRCESDFISVSESLQEKPVDCAGHAKAA
ncbi:MAG: HD domain-containing phosphohydrolase [Planctomycetota bacterium]